MNKKTPQNQMVFDILILQFGWGIPMFTDIHMQEIIWWFQFVTGLIWKSSRLFCTFLLALLEFLFPDRQTGSSLISALK